MNKIASPTMMLAMLLPLLMVSPSCKKESFLEQRGELSILQLEGTPFERGQAHGLLLKQEIHENTPGTLVMDLR